MTVPLYLNFVLCDMIYTRLSGNPSGEFFRYNIIATLFVIIFKFVTNAIFKKYNAAFISVCCENLDFENLLLRLQFKATI